MADDETTTETEATETVSAETETQETAHPETEKLDRIIAQRLGKYAARTERAETEAATLRERVARLEGASQAAQSQAQAPKFYTVEQLQMAVDRGSITPAVMADQLAWQRSVESERRLEQKQALQSKQSMALTEVQDYIRKLPGLSDTSSEDFRKVAAEAREIAEDTGMSIDDPRVQRRACRAVFGPLDRLADRQKTREFSRQHADSFVEHGGGGGRESGATADPLKDVPKDYLAFWKARGYSRDQMLAEAKYIRRIPRKVVG